MKNKELLKLKVESDDHPKDLTIKGYLKLLLIELWREGESFSGKRPFGNSGWEWDLYKPLVKAGVIKGEFDEDGYLDTFDMAEADKLVAKLIKDL